jgi:uncharacterized protein YdbL (DUF1318 family)
MNTSFARFLCCVALAVVPAVVVQAEVNPVETAKAAMRERVPALDRLKATGAVGEANTGLVAVRTASADTEALVAAENADRAVLFADLARRNGGTVEAAGREFARQLARASKPGVWLQRDDGTWYRK